MSERFIQFDREAFPAQFYLQVKEGMARFEVPDAGNLSHLLTYCESHGYSVEWTGSVQVGTELERELRGFPGGRYVAHLLPGAVLDPEWKPPEAPALN